MLYKIRLVMKVKYINNNLCLKNDVRLMNDAFKIFIYKNL